MITLKYHLTYNYHYFKVTFTILINVVLLIPRICYFRKPYSANKKA